MCLVWIGGAASGCVSARERSLSTGQAELLERADRAFDLGARDEAIELYRLAAVAAQTESDEERFRESAAMVAALHALLGQPAEAEPWLSQAEVGIDASQIDAWSRLLLAQGLVARTRGQEGLALQRFDELHGFTMKHRKVGRALQAASLAALVAKGEQRIAWSQQAVDTAREGGEPRWEAAALASHAWTLEEAGDAAAALEAFRKSRKMFGEFGGPRERLKADWSLGHGLRMAGEHATARALMDRVLKAAKALQRRGWSPRDSEWVARSHEELAHLCRHRGQLDTALKHLAAARRAYGLANAEALAPERLEEVDALSAAVRAQQEGALDRAALEKAAAQEASGVR